MIRRTIRKMNADERIWATLAAIVWLGVIPTGTVVLATADHSPTVTIATENAR